MAKAIALVLGSQGAELGSAFAVTDEYALTARHCLTDSATRQRITEPKVLLRFEQGTEIVADLCGESQSADIAILRFRNSLPVNLKPLPLLPPTSSHDGASFKAFGYPKQRPSPNYSAIHGEIVDAEILLHGYSRVLLHSDEVAAGQGLEGFSGGPVVIRCTSPSGIDSDIAIGIVSWASLDTDGVAASVGALLYAVPVSAVLDEWQYLPEYSEPITTRTIGSRAQLRARVGLPDRRWFVGRSGELKSLDPSPETRVTVVTGRGGSGKSALILEYLQRRDEERKRPAFIWWFDASSRQHLVDQVGALARYLAGDTEGATTRRSESLDAEQDAQGFRYWLENLGESWLLVFDGADNPSVIDRLVPRKGNGEVLISSRSRKWSTDFRELSLSDLSRTDAVDLLERQSGLGDPEGAASLASALGCLALSLEQAGAFLAQKREIGQTIDYDSYATLLGQQTNFLHRWDFAGIEATAAQVVSTSLDAIGEAAAGVLRVLSFLGSGSIPSVVLSSETAYQEPLLHCENSLALHVAIAELHNYCLIEVSGERRDASYSLHSVVRQVLRTLPDVGDEHEATAVRLLSRVIRRHPQNWDASAGAATTEQLLPHVLEVARSLNSGNEIESLLRIMNSTAGLMIWRVDPGAAQLVDRSYELSLKYLEPSHYEALAARDNRYDLSARRGRVEAIAEYERLARDCGGWLGRDDGLTLHVRSNLAFRLVQFEQLDEAIRRYKKLADDFRRVYGSESPEFLAVRGHLAAARAKTTVASDLRLAISEFESLVKDFALTQGADHPNTLRTRFNLIRAKELLLPPGDALVLLAGLVDDFDRVQGSDHIDTLIARARLAELTVVSGSGVEGLQRFDALVEDVRRDYGIDHPFTLMFRQRAAICRGEAIGPLAALGASTTLIEDYERVLGSDCADTINARGQEAQWVAQSGAVSDAIDLYAKIIEDSQLYLGADHLHTLAAREMRASWLVAMAGATEADRQQAIQELEEVLQDYRRVFGSSNPNTARVEALLIKARQRVAGSDDSRTRPAVRPSRNDPCWCGSGQKFKRCHGSR